MGSNALRSTQSNRYLPRENLNKLSLKKTPSIYLEMFLNIFPSFFFFLLSAQKKNIGFPAYIESLCSVSSWMDQQDR